MKAKLSAPNPMGKEISAEVDCKVTPAGIEIGPIPQDLIKAMDEREAKKDQIIKELSKFFKSIP